MLIELSRLEPEPLKQFLKKHPTAGLKKLPFNEFKKLVRGLNPKKRNRGGSENASGDSTVNVKVLAEKIKSNFDKVRVEFDGGSSLDTDLGPALGELSHLRRFVFA